MHFLLGTLITATVNPIFILTLFLQAIAVPAPNLPTDPVTFARRKHSFHLKSKRSKGHQHDSDDTKEITLGIGEPHLDSS
jgi:hypothetical protein